MNNKHDNRVVIVNSSFGNLIDISMDEVFHEFRELVLSSDAEILFEFKNFRMSTFCLCRIQGWINHFR